MKPNLSDAWLSGFTYAEGCFNVAIQPQVHTVTGYRISLRFLLDPKNAESTLLHVRDLFKFGLVKLLPIGEGRLTKFIDIITIHSKVYFQYVITF